MNGTTAQRVWGALGLLCALATGTAVQLSRDLTGRLREHVTLWLLAGLCWLLAVAWGMRGGAVPRGAVVWLWAVALLLRLPCWLSLPRHSDDVYRYLWDGEVQARGGDPYAGPPDADRPAYRAARAAQPEVFSRINHRELPTVYPPAAQRAFALAAHLGRLRGTGLPAALWGWRVVVGAADLLILWLLCRICRDPRQAAIWGWSPLCAVELGQEAHMDALGILPLCLALYLLAGQHARARETCACAAGAAWAASVLTKPLGLVLLPGMLSPGRLDRRARLGLLAGALLLSLACLLPLIHAGAGLAGMRGSLGEYSRRWRGNDGAFALLQAGAEAAVARAYPPEWHARPWQRQGLARLLTGRARDNVRPDELANALARAAALLLWLLAPLAVWRRGPDLPLGHGALALVIAYLLLTPMLHPWYVLWGLALCPLWPEAAGPVLALAVLAPLGYLPLGAYLQGRPWTEAAWPRLVEHGAAWLLLGLAQAGAARRDSRRGFGV